MIRIGAQLVLCLLLLSGCVTKSNTNGIQNEPDCTRAYSLDCDDNQDAKELLEQYGLHQITNTTANIGGPNLDGGWIAWLSGGRWGDPTDRHAFKVTNHAHFLTERYYDSNTNRHTKGDAGWGLRASSTGIAYGLFPIESTSDAAIPLQEREVEVFIWNPLNGGTHRVPLVEGRALQPNDFDGEWILARELLGEPGSGVQDGLSAIHATTGQEIVLFEGGGPGGTPVGQYFKQPFVAQKVSAGSAFVSYAREDRGIRFDVSLIEYELATGEQRFLLDYEGPPLHEFDVNPEYVVTSGFNSSIGYTLNIYSRANQTWWHPVVPDGAAAGTPRVGGDWIVYMEAYPGSQAQPNLRAFHVPTKTYHTLIDTQPGMHLIEWDTDGQSVMVKLALTTGRNLPWLYEGEQLYWMPLPEVGS